MHVAATILIPVLDNEGGSLEYAHEAIRLEALSVFGGYTEHPPAQGAWIAPDGDLKEGMIPFMVSSGAPDGRGLIRAFARGVKHQCRQEAVLLIWHHGTEMI